MKAFHKKGPLLGYGGLLAGPVLGGLSTWAVHTNSQQHGDTHNAIFYIGVFTAVALPCCLGGLIVLFCLKKLEN